MALLETNGDYMFAENVEELSRSVSKLNEALDEQLEINQNLMNSVRQLTEVIEFQNVQFRKLMKSFGCDDVSDFIEKSATNNLRPDFVLM